jgi:hypothetical protein
MQLIVQMPEKGVTAINFTVTGFDVTDVLCSALDKVCEWNRVDSKTCHIIIYGGKRKLTNDDVVKISGYQTAKDIKMTNVVASDENANQINIVNRYKRG